MEPNWWDHPALRDFREQQNPLTKKERRDEIIWLLKVVLILAVIVFSLWGLAEIVPLLFGNWHGVVPESEYFRYNGF